MLRIVEYKDWGPVPPNSRPARISRPREAWLHHGASGSAFHLDSAQAHARYHIQSLGWQHVGYSALVVLYPEPMLLKGRILMSGAHTGGRNDISAGVCAPGNVTYSDIDSDAIEALAEALIIGDSQGWWPREFRGGHRDAPGASTSCPGDALHGVIDEINQLARKGRSHNLGDRVIRLRDPYMRGSDVEELQDQLRELGYSPGDSGIAGPSTMEAASKFWKDATGDTVSSDSIRLGARFAATLETHNQAKPRWNMLLYGQRGTPDHIAATAVATASGDDVVVTDSKAMAEDEIERGGTVIAVGGPAAEDLPDAEHVVGSHAIDTVRKLAERLA